MRRRQIVAGFVVGAVALAGSVFAHGLRPGETVGVPRPTGCPADVDNDGNVGVLDFLQVLAAWGPCPSPALVTGIASAGSQECHLMARQRSDGTLEVLDPFLGYTSVAPASSHLGTVIDISMHEAGAPDCSLGSPCGEQGFFWTCGVGGRFVIIRQYLDGHAESMYLAVCRGPEPGLCFNWLYSDWQPVPPPP